MRDNDNGEQQFASKLLNKKKLRTRQRVHTTLTLI